MPTIPCKKLHFSRIFWIDSPKITAEITIFSAEMSNYIQGLIDPKSLFSGYDRSVAGSSFKAAGFCSRSHAVLAGATQAQVGRRVGSSARPRRNRVSATGPVTPWLSVVGRLNSLSQTIE